MDLEASQLYMDEMQMIIVASALCSAEWQCSLSLDQCRMGVQTCAVLNESAD